MRAVTKLTAGGAGAAMLGVAGFVAQNPPGDVAQNVCDWTRGIICLVRSSGEQPIGIPTLEPSGTPPTDPTKASQPAGPSVIYSAPPAPAPAAASPIKVTVEPILRSEANGREFNLFALMQVRVKNEGTVPAHVAWGDVAHTSEVILENGMALKPSRGSNTRPKGLVSCRNTLEHCWQNYGSDFSIVNPGQAVTGYVYYVNSFPVGQIAEARAIKTLSYSARLFVVAPGSDFRQVQPVDFTGVSAKNMIR
jgi:hypothetical protein